MKLFELGDVLSVTTGRIVSSRHIDGVYAILNFLTGHDLSAEQLPRAADECEPWLRRQFPSLMEDSAGMPERLADMDLRIKGVQQDCEHIGAVIRVWVEELRIALKLPEMLSVYEMGAEARAISRPSWSGSLIASEPLEPSIYTDKVLDKGCSDA